MQDPTDLMERLETAASAIADAAGPSEVFGALLDGVSACAPRVALFLCRGGSLHGWAERGYGDGASERLGETVVPVGSGWPARLATEDAADRAFRTPDEVDRAVRLDERVYRESLGAAVRVGGRTLAVVLAERDAGERPWDPSAMTLLATVARMRLEVDLARRRLQRAAAASPPPDLPTERRDAPSAPVETAPPPPARVTEAPTFEIDLPPDEAQAAPEPSGLAPADVPPPTDPASVEEEAARRFARLVATDIRLYNEEDVVVGRRNRDLASRMKDQLDRGRETFRRRFPDLGEDGDRILREAFVNVLAGGDPALLPDRADGRTGS